MANGAVTWDILIATIPHRHESLCGLLAHLHRQMKQGVGVRLYRDNLEVSYGGKCATLLASSEAEYVSFLDDDDTVTQDYMHRVCRALRWHPDYVGFLVRYTIDGEPGPRVEHSLRHTGWVNTQEILTRDIVHFNPIRRELALLGTWEGGNGADRRWADGVRASGKVQREKWISHPVHCYQERTADNFLTPREPVRGPLPQLPAYPWLTILEPA